ncbi:ubiquitin-conjugating enzyme E2 [Mesorhizobium sp. BR1-1-2]|uniref:ubiquitin-conjugating enzyme E2 n=1 Tax=Mesorhizobium sp. BR1-1-2 TaxID=2876652 RepID=UPI001CCAB8BE|nr:ubiquitin-conjugating enzyme E2 [Mesorhizobium sp. BR1-1-2]MBZ9963733.1 hypothetical protein [Mesorhizobium sp. BR1-1-2]
MSAFDERRAQDVQKLRDLERLSRSRVRVTKVVGNPTNEIEAELHLRTAPSSAYPSSVQPVTRISISLPARYPFVEPTVNVGTPILHPNVYTSGRICLGLKWIPSFGLDLLVRRVVQIVTFDPTVLNLQSPANRAAVSWYQQAIRSNPQAFPTDVIDFSVQDQAKTMAWRNAEPAVDAKTVVTCSHCNARLSVPNGRSGTVKCPKCGNGFAVKT